MDQITIGNVKFYKSDVEQNLTTTKTENGQKIFNVFLKNGTQMSFKEQTQGSNASVTCGHYGDEATYGRNNATGFSGIDGLKIKGTNKSEYYHITCCNNFEVDVTGGGKERDEIRVFTHKNISSYKILKSANDKYSYFNSADGGFFSKNEGYIMKCDKDCHGHPDGYVSPWK